MLYQDTWLDHSLSQVKYINNHFLGYNIQEKFTFCFVIRDIVLHSNKDGGKRTADLQKKQNTEVEKQG